LSLRCLVVGNFTVDLIDGNLQLGGASFYGGWALYLLGCETYVVSSINMGDRRLLDLLEGKLQIHIQPCEETTTFVIRNGSAVKLLKQGCRLDWDLISKVIDTIDPDVVVIAPVYMEIDVDKFINCREFVKACSLDLQGFTRRAVEEGLINVWHKGVEKALHKVDLVHGNIREYCFSHELHEILATVRELSLDHGNAHQVSLDSNGLYLVTDNTILFYPPKRVEVVSDVGAGDVLLAVTTYYMAKGFDVIEATKRGLAAALLKITSTSLEWFDQERVEDASQSIIYVQYRNV